MRQLVRCFALVQFAILTGTVPPGLAESFVSGLAYERQGDGFLGIPHARIEARSNAAVVAWVEADDFGHYVLSGLPAGEVTLAVSHPRYYPVRGAEGKQRSPIRCPATGSCGEVIFEMIPSGELEVRVTDSNGNAIDDVRVSVRALTNPNNEIGWRLKQRGVHGVFRTAAMHPGRYRVRAEPTKSRRDGAHHPVESDVEFAYGQTSKSVRLVMPFTKAYRVSGIVEGLLHWNALHSLIVLRPEAEEHGDGEGKRLGATLDKDGAFVLNGVPRGAYLVKLKPVDGTALNARGPDVLLGSSRVENDVAGLAFALPDSLNPN